jgi:hypothetical protein
MRSRGAPSTELVTGPGVRLDGEGAVDVRGRLIGGCIETVRHLVGTSYGDISRFRHDQASEGLIIYVEAAGDDAYAICRSLHPRTPSGRCRTGIADSVTQLAPSVWATGPVFTDDTEHGGPCPAWLQSVRLDANTPNGAQGS